MSFSAYPEYGDSGLDWIPRIPVHWAMGRLRWLSTMYAGGTPDKKIEAYWEDGTIPWLNSGAVNQELITKPSAYISQEAFESSSAKWIPDGSLVIALAGQGKTKGMVAQLGIKTTCNQSMAAIVPYEGILPRFLLWWLSSNYQNIRNLSGGDLRDGLNLQLIGTIPCPIPDKSEQQAIANFLDRETAKIDALVAEQRRLIELLSEKRQAVISHAVTKGLDPNVKMKPSGIEWLGDVPEHWEVKSVRHCCRVDNNLRTPIDRQTRQLIEGKYPYYGPTGVLSHIDRYVIDGEFFLLGEDGDHFLKFQKQPMTIHVEGRFNVNNHAHVIQGIGTNSTKWACLFFEHRDLMPWLIKQGVGRYKLRKEKLLTIPMLIPPAEEQQTILTAIEKVKKNTKVLIEQAKQAISILAERRTSLISAVVTGKIDVREFACQEAS